MVVSGVMLTAWSLGYRLFWSLYSKFQIDILNTGYGTPQELI